MAMHPNIAAPQSTRKQRFLDRIGGHLIGIIAPELLVHLAYGEKEQAEKNLKLLLELQGNPKVSWTLTHCFYDDMGGFAVRYNASGRVDPYAEKIAYLGAETICGYIRDGRIDPRHWVSKEEIQAKGKADPVLATLTLLQAGYFIWQSATRLGDHLPLTTIEVITLAYIVYAIPICWLWWDKPYHVKTPSYLIVDAPRTYLHRPDPRRPWITVCDVNRNYPLITKDHVVYTITGHYFEALHSIFHPLGPNRISACLFLIVGAIHIAAWDVEFPTTIERMAWRVCSVVITASIPISWLFSGLLLWLATGNWWKEIWDDVQVTSRTVKWFKKLALTFHGTCVVVYAAARLYLFVEAIAALRYTAETRSWT